MQFTEPQVLLVMQLCTLMRTNGGNSHNTQTMSWAKNRTVFDINLLPVLATSNRTPACTSVFITVAGQDKNSDIVSSATQKHKYEILWTSSPPSNATLCFAWNMCGVPSHNTHNNVWCRKHKREKGICYTYHIQGRTAAATSYILLIMGAGRDKHSEFTPLGRPEI